MRCGATSAGQNGPLLFRYYREIYSVPAGDVSRMHGPLGSPLEMTMWNQDGEIVAPKQSRDVKKSNENYC